MMEPRVNLNPNVGIITKILNKFEDEIPLSSDELNFLYHHEKSLSNQPIDQVIKYYLTAHKNDHDKALSFTIPKDKLNHENMHEIGGVVHDLLAHNLNHVDLKMSFEQYLKFKSLGIHELVFWHGPQFLARSVTAMPHVLYFQWGKLFGVVKLCETVGNLIVDGNVLIYFEDVNDRSLNKCILEYTKKHKMDELILQNRKIENAQLELIHQPLKRLII